jgi:hypothetical protein
MEKLIFPELKCAKLLESFFFENDGKPTKLLKRILSFFFGFKNQIEMIKERL